MSAPVGLDSFLIKMLQQARFHAISAQKIALYAQVYLSARSVKVLAISSIKVYVSRRHARMGLIEIWKLETVFYVLKIA